MKEVKKRLDEEVIKRNSPDEISKENLDPILVAKRYNDATIALICALFAYGNVKQIVKFLDSLDFSLLEQSDEVIQKSLQMHYYRFQKPEDVIALFIALKRLGKVNTLEEIFRNGYMKKMNVIDGIHEMIRCIQNMFEHNSKGYTFLLSKINLKTKGSGALKRWMMYLRWMTRKDNIDMGLWSDEYKPNLIMPLDTHTFSVSQKLGLLKRKTYDLEAAIELTNKLKKFDNEDPLKYDFALYRLGQNKLV